ITVTITPAFGSVITYYPGDPAVRSVINLYPDPVSSLVVSQEINQDLTPYAITYGDVINSAVTDYDKDWWQTMVFIDLPADFPVGMATVTITSVAGEIVTSNLVVVDGLGQTESFLALNNGSLSVNQLSSMERVNNYAISFSSTVIPYAIEVGFSHFADAANGGTGSAYIVNPRGDIKSVLWKDDGRNLKVLLTPTHSTALSNIQDFKFYVAGGITGLVLGNINAVDSAGQPIAGVTAAITVNN
ncbi:MAG: hypothetical protein OEY89_16680, partial [Gammaproteobacteria bacterium]|nr:hypothetical protein [Gammaproteobacteria bacterium]